MRLPVRGVRGIAGWSTQRPHVPALGSVHCRRTVAENGTHLHIKSRVRVSNVLHGDTLSVRRTNRDIGPCLLCADAVRHKLSSHSIPGRCQHGHLRLCVRLFAQLHDVGVARGSTDSDDRQAVSRPHRMHVRTIPVAGAGHNAGSPLQGLHYLHRGRVREDSSCMEHGPRVCGAQAVQRNAMGIPVSDFGHRPPM